MPFVVPFIPLILGGIGAVTGAISAFKRPQQPSLPTAAAAGPSAADQARQAAIDRLARARAIREQLPGLQEQVGGSVSPEYYAQVASMLSGTGEDQNTALQEALRRFGVGGEGQGADFLALSGLTPGGSSTGVSNTYSGYSGSYGSSGYGG